jgi:adenylyl-sulfate kinase
VVWLTGLSGSGKSTLAAALEQRLVAGGRAAYVLDGDNIRHGLNADLGFSPDHRDENIRRIGEVAALFADAGLIAITAFISPYRSARDRARRAARNAPFLEVFVRAPLDVCERRDPKGLYAKARAGALHDFTGIDAPYEPPAEAALTLDTAAQSVDDCVEAILALLAERGVLDGAKGP